MLQAAKEGVLCACMGLPPLIAAEAARRAIPTDVRPSFEEMEQAVKRVAK